jgi:6-pyruvoyltetrahydropterin/6-carboxytetrahydropterin synthase
MTERGEFRVSVTKDYLVFASAHFITFAGHRCESLHGHNYRAGVVIEGTLDPESWYVFDFVMLKRIMRGLCDEIDHKVLLPLDNPRLQVSEQGDSIAVAYDHRPRYLFPKGDCALLPVPNTTVEMLAQHLTRKLRSKLREDGAERLTSIEIEIEESVGQSAFYRLDVRDGG